MAGFDLSTAAVVQAFPQFASLVEIGRGGQKIVYRATEAGGTHRALKIVK